MGSRLSGPRPSEWTRRRQQFPCLTCGARPGDPCRMTWGKQPGRATNIHNARTRALETRELELMQR
jgi:hypothetical protein